MAGKTETFQLVRNDVDKNRMRIRAPNGSFLQANKDGSVTANFGESTTWGDNDPSVFAVNIVNGPHGEYQICNGYGKDMATQVMNNHWSTYIVEADFAFMAANGLNAVRIPVGWWIASDPNPPAPFVGGALQALDSAFTWAEYILPPVLFTLHIRMVSSQTSQSLTIFIYKKINILHAKVIQYKTLSHNTSTGIDFTF
uniref:DUF7910 domain-containing protein n=1 Tax=Aegilops tauschii subsp. strangulata TaxID=200361 RepID=A0A452Y2A0_AEGTS